MEVVTEKHIQSPDTAALVVVDEEERAASQEEPDTLKDLYDDIGTEEQREESPDLTQFDDVIPQAKTTASQDDVYY